MAVVTLSALKVSAERMLLIVCGRTRHTVPAGRLSGAKVRPAGAASVREVAGLSTAWQCSPFSVWAAASFPFQMVTARTKSRSATGGSSRLMQPQRCDCYNPGWMFTGIEHFAIASPDPKRLAEWYVVHLAFRINYEHAGNYFVKAPNGTILEIIPSEGERDAATPKTPGLRHIAIAVENFRDVRLKSCETRTSCSPDLRTRTRATGSSFSKTRDGNLLHLIQRQQPLP